MPHRQHSARRTLFTVLAALGAATALGGTSGALAQGSYPDRAIRFIVPQPAGGTGDVISRMVTQSMAKRLGQAIVVENRPVAGGSVGAALVAKAAPDGYSLVLGSPGFSTFAALYKNLSLNPATDFAPVGMMGIVPVALIVRSESGFRNAAEVIAEPKKSPGKVTYASAGQGSLSHLIGAWFVAETGTDMLHVPYAGTAPALTALIGGQVDVAFDAMASAAMIKAGRVRVLAVAEGRRSPLLPDAATLLESNVKVRGSVWGWASSPPAARRGPSSSA